MDVPFGFFGHSVGALTAYEAARQLRAADGRSAAHLFVSARASPQRASAHRHLARVRSDDELRAILDRFGGTPPAIMQRPELVAALLPALRADLMLAEGYRVEPGARIACPITAFGGAEEFPHSGWLETWRDFTHAEFRARIFAGDHFYFSPAADALVAEITRDLSATAHTPTATRSPT
jgi:medium-chain acyl-[acyl-carrier-protein] hydrolase